MHRNLVVGIERGMEGERRGNGGFEPKNRTASGRLCVFGVRLLSRLRVTMYTSICEGSQECFATRW